MKVQKNNYKHSIGYGIKVFRSPYPVSHPTKKIEAVLFKLGKRGIWIFRNQQVRDNWPKQN